MEKKIIILGLVLSLITSCSQKKLVSVTGVNKVKVKYDTIFFGSEKSLINYVDTFQIDDTKRIKDGLILKSKGTSVSVWIDSLMFHYRSNNRFISVVSSLDYGYSLLYFNGDSLSVEKIAINKPKIKNYDMKKFSVLCITDSTYNSGRLIKSKIFYKYNIFGKITNRKEYFMTKEGDFKISTKSKRDSLLISDKIKI